MPMRSTFDVERNRFDVRGSGRVTFEEIVANNRWYIGQPQFREDMDVLVDLTEATLAGNGPEMRPASSRVLRSARTLLFGR